MREIALASEVLELESGIEIIARMIAFEVHGPFKVPTERWKSGRIIPKDLTDFWDGTGLGERCGVYIFGIRAGRGITPIYVGKATRRFAVRHSRTISALTITPMRSPATGAGPR